MRLIVISGRSGSGKTIALHALEDLGFYCIDNLPILFLPELEQEIGDLHPLVAVSLDARNISNPIDATNLKDMVQDLHQRGKSCEILYLDADENVLLQRFSETRRKHPLTDSNTSLREAIRKERDILTPIAALADLTIDTSPLNRQALHNLIRDRVTHHNGSQIQLLLKSFGFKHGLPPDADFVFDVRCLPNPYWQIELRALTGQDSPVIQFLQNCTEVQNMLDNLCLFLETWIPHFEADNRSYMTIAIGCTGGQHRSVYMVESLAKKLGNKIGNMQIRHRELKTEHINS